MKFSRKLSFIVSFFLIFSCADSLDFNQIEGYVFKPIFTSALTFFTAVPAQFFDDNGNQINRKEDKADFDAFKYTYLRNNAVKLVFNAEFKNEFDRDVNIQVDFLDRNNIIIYRFTEIFVEKNTINPPAYEEEIIIADNRIILSATQVRIVAELEDTGVPLNANDTRIFEFKSSATLFIESDL
jgi:hypothetical protein